jgi:hypothetical protein
MIFGYHLWGVGRNVEKEQFEKAVASAAKLLRIDPLR